MTRSVLLTHLMANRQRSAIALTVAFGHAWEEPVRSLLDLELVRVSNCGRGNWMFHVNWGGAQWPDFSQSRGSVTTRQGRIVRS